MRVIAVIKAVPPEPGAPSSDVVAGGYDLWRYLDKPVFLPRRLPGPYQCRISRPEPRALPVRPQRVLPPGPDETDEDQ